MSRDRRIGLKRTLGIVDKHDWSSCVHGLYEEGITCRSTERGWAGMIEAVIDADRDGARLMSSGDQLCEDGSIQDSTELFFAGWISCDKRQ
jgi:hypothetical protein